MRRKQKDNPHYSRWVAMKQRCYNPNAHGYRYYGGLGVTVCDEWLHDAWAFADAIGTPPTPAHTLDRIDPTGNYEPSNVRWLTIEEQQQNRRPLAPDHRAKIAASRKKRYAQFGTYKHTEETKEKMKRSQALRRLNDMQTKSS
ncbi:MAG: hypothetical protein ACODTL_16245 [Brucella sp.]